MNITWSTHTTHDKWIFTQKRTGLWSRRLDPAASCSWTSCWPGWSSVRSPRTDPSSPGATDTDYARTTPSASSETSPWNSSSSPHRPRSSSAAGTSSVPGTCPPLPEVALAASPLPRNAPSTKDFAVEDGCGAWRSGFPGSCRAPCTDLWQRRLPLLPSARSRCCGCGRRSARTRGTWPDGRCCRCSEGPRRRRRSVPAWSGRMGKTTGRPLGDRRGFLAELSQRPGWMLSNVQLMWAHRAGRVGRMDTVWVRIRLQMSTWQLGMPCTYPPPMKTEIAMEN